MSKQLIRQYHANVEKLIRYGGSRNESVLRKAFQELVDHYARKKNLVLVPEVEYITKKGHKVYPDGTLKDALRQNWGFWESKDEKDILKDEIATKFAKGYPNFNILFEDTHTAILFQNCEMVMSASFGDEAALDKLLNLFVSYEPQEVREFHKAIAQFNDDIPELVKTLRAIIDEQLEASSIFKNSLCTFLELCRKAINPKVEMADVREMMIQHILTEDIFMRVFDEAEFHRENIIARNLQEVAGTFYKGATKRAIDARIAPYYETINARAAQISDHHEKQKFLKALYENFYKAYNPKAADRLGVIYTPDEIVRFMIEGTDYLLNKHFDKCLSDNHVEILDPATGTGTFITELIEFLPPEQLKYKYENEIHCNEVAILPYYIANLNIEFTYKQKTNEYLEFQNICFVDTLDNLGFTRSGEQQLNFFGLFDENAERIGKQNTRKISVIMGNPPYNAWQENFNNLNANRQYPGIDSRIKETYIKAGTAQNKNSVYDMYTRFLRWASDRLYSNGIIAFVSNNSFIDSKAYDGFRKVVEKEFNDIYIVDMKGNARCSGDKRRREGGNIFNDQIKVGVAIYFMVRRNGQKGCNIHYCSVNDFATASEKSEYLREYNLKDIKFIQLQINPKGYWLQNEKNDWNNLMPLSGESKALFYLSSNGLKTQRDEWVYDFSRVSLEEKIKFFIDTYTDTRNEPDNPNKMQIKWDRELTKYLERKINLSFDTKKIVTSYYRPFVKTFLYLDKYLNAQVYKQFSIFPGKGVSNKAICWNVGNSGFNVLVVNAIPDLHFNGDSQCFPLYQISINGDRTDNITDWSLLQFQKHYKDKAIKKEDIFYYVYAVLHSSTYRKTYDQNLKLELPRIPYYLDFHKWVIWGRKLCDLHVNFENIEPYNLLREDKDTEKLRKAIVPRLIGRKEAGTIEIDTKTTLLGVPKEVWEYRLGTYSAIEWILERYKERMPKDSTIFGKFNNYKFSDYKDQVIDLIMRVCTVSVETQKIINSMPN